MIAELPDRSHSRGSRLVVRRLRPSPPIAFNRGLAGDLAGDGAELARVVVAVALAAWIAAEQRELAARKQKN